MIRRHEGSATWLITQGAHAYIAGQIMAHWVGSGVLQPEPRDEIVLAAYTHDAGWSAFDQQPTINAGGQPRTFTEMTLDDHFAIWERSILSVFDQNRYAGLLACLHCLDLYDQRLRYLDDPPDDKARIQGFFDRWTIWKDHLIHALTDHPRYSLAVQPATLAQNARLLQVVDFLSLVLCMGPVHEQSLENVPRTPGTTDLLHVASGGPRTMLLNSFPLDAPLQVWIDAKQVFGGPFESDAALQATLNETRYRPLVFEIAPTT